jgi:NitT/TauT family transport system substrate-binding protein
MNPRSRRLLSASIATLALALAVTPMSQAVTKTKPKAKAVAVTRLAKLATAPVVRLGFFANVTHASALIAQQERFFEKYLGADGTKIEYTLFNAGPSAIEAMKGGALDVSYIGPSPSISGYVTTNGELLRIVSGATSGGAQLVVKPGINSLDDLNGKLVATPQLGNTQDVAIRAYLKSKGFTTNAAGKRNVLIQPTDNALTLTLFKNGQIDGAWLPEPWASRLVLEAGAKVLVDEKDIWPNGDFLTTDIIAKADFLRKYPGTVRSILQANLDAIAFAKANPVVAQNDVQAQLLKWTTRKLSDNVIQRAWSNIRLIADPLPSTLQRNYEDATALGLLPIYKANALKGIFDIRLLNSVLRFRKSSTYTVGALGLA